MTEDIAHWPAGTVRIAWHALTEPELPLTGAHGFCFYQGNVLVCDIIGRGLTIPGGHTSENERPVDCLRREAAEEAGVELANVRLLGFIEADHRSNSKFDGRYPLRSVQAIYRANVCAVWEFAAQRESICRRFVSTGELPRVHHEWNAVLQTAFEAALDF